MELNRAIPTIVSQGKPLCFYNAIGGKLICAAAVETFVLMAYAEDGHEQRF